MLVGPYEIASPLDEHPRRHRAVHVATGRVVALQRLYRGPPLPTTRAAYDALHAAAAPFVIELLELFSFEGEVMLATAWPDERSLASARHTLPGSIMRTLFLCLLTGLEQLHAADVYHGILRPERILLDDQSLPIMTDLESLSPYPSSYREPAVTTTTPPERVRNGASGAEGDVYAIAAMVWEHVSGKPLFDMGHPGDFATTVVEEPAPSLAGILDVPSADVIMRALHKQPEQRPSAGELHDAIAAIALEPSPLATGNALLAAVAAQPADAAARLVYMDWLEERGLVDQLTWMQLDDRRVTAPDDAELLAQARRLAATTHVGWRRTVSHARIANCPMPARDCPGRWDVLEPVARADVRHCATCDQLVEYIVDDDALPVLPDRPLALDVSVARKSGR